VVAAHRAIGKNLRKTTDMKKENEIAIQRQKKIFSKAKEEFDRIKANV
jgi:hypothetical protein